MAESFVRLFSQPGTLSVTSPRPTPPAATSSLSRGTVDAFPGLPTSPSEYAVYFVGGADRYAIPGVATGIVNYLQDITKTAAGAAPPG